MLNRTPRLVGLQIFLALLVFSTACSSDGPSAPDPKPSDGVAQFRYAGSGFDGDFKAAGIFERDGTGGIKPQSFATAVDVSLPQYQLAYFGIVAADFHHPELDALSILLSGQVKGEYPVMTAEDCSSMIQFGTGACSAIGFDFQLGADGTYTTNSTSFELVDGVVTVSSVTGGRLTGSFRGTARQFGDWAAGELYAPGIEVAVTDGTFDVPVITLDAWNGTAQLNPNILAPLKLLVQR
jgi:hypothetical protein